MPEKFYCYICKNIIYGKRQIKRHALIHFKGERCPYCGMKVENFIEHFANYHLGYRKKAIFRRDLAILVKEFGNTKILYDKNLNLTKADKSAIKELLEKL